MHRSEKTTGSVDKQDMARRGFFKRAAVVAGVLALVAVAPGGVADALAATGKAEKPQLKFGFIKLTDMVPLAIAYEKGYFQDEGLSVTLEAQSNWKLIVDRTISGELDGAHMLAGQPIAATIGFGTKADMVTAFSMDLNGNGITVSNAVWNELKKIAPKQPDGKVMRPLKAEYVKKVVDNYKNQGKTFKWGVVFPVSTHNYELRYWLASGGIHPGFYAPHKGDNAGQLNADVLISVTPPPQMPATMEAGTIDGYCVGEPWNQQAVFKGIGAPVITDYEIQKNNPEKVFAVTEEWARKYPNTHIRVVKALIRAGYWLDAENNKNRKEASKIISQPNYVGADYDVIANSMTGTYEYEKGDVRKVPDFNTFFRYHATYPYYSDAIWYLTQMRRWGQIPESKPDSWYLETAKKVYRPDVYAMAAKELIAEGKLKASDFPNFAKETGFKPAQKDFIDGVVYDGRKPNDYINKMKIGLKGNDKL
jgi:nitrate/nitrite transport system substrate-binding protein